jgi:colanic acid/amylovoran biosynthesis protein
VWVEQCTQIIEALGSAFTDPLVLVPHVTVPGSSDHLLSSTVMERLRRSRTISGRTLLLDDKYSAAELKYIIGHLRILVGARMHALVAALSAGTPVLGISYSTKTIGLLRDMFGNDEYHLPADTLTPQAVATRVRSILASERQIRASLGAALPTLRARARYAVGVFCALW